jgi:hypothetical protein
MLTRIVWPCILAEQNLPTFMRECQAIYRICTTRRDQQKLREMAIFRSISALVRVEFVDTPTEEPDPMFHMDRIFKGIDDAREDKAIFFHVWPDVVFTDRTLGNAARALKEGSAGCVLSSLRVVSETCAAELMEKCSQNPDGPMAISPGEVVRLGVRHMHPLSATSFVDAVHGRPETCILFRVPGEGLIARGFFNWLFVDPGRITIAKQVPRPTTNDPDPGRLVHIVSDSDDMMFLSLAPLAKELEVLRPICLNEPIDVARMTMHPWPSAFYDIVDKIPARLHYGAMTEEVWQLAVRRSDFFFRRVRAMRALMRVRRLLEDEGCRKAARLISVALFTLKVPDKWLIEVPLTIFVPVDQAIEALPSGEFTRLLDRRFRGDLMRAMFDHVVIGTNSIPANGEVGYQSLGGGRIRIADLHDEISINKTHKVLRELRSGPHRICLIDRVIDRGTPTTPPRGF